MRTIASLLLLISSCFLCVTAQSINKTDIPAQAGNVVTGRVLIHGNALAGATVLVWRWPSTEPQPDATWKSQTDERGNYRITNLAAGNYYISAKSEGFISIEKGEPAHPRYFAIAAGGIVNGIDFEMVRGGVVTGRVTTGEGLPVAQEPVRLIVVDALTPSPISGRTVSSVGLATKTDDQGVYKLSGIPPGRYRAVTGLPCLAMSTIKRRPAFDRVFYPNVSEESKAKLIEIGEGREISDVDITLGPKVDLFTISGRLLDETGQPIADLNYGLDILTDPKSPCGVSGAGATNSRGEFKIENVPAGRYSIRVPPSLFPTTAAPPAFFSERETFDVRAQDITIDVHLMRTGTLSGVVLLEDTSDKTALEKLSQLSMRVSSLKTGSPVSVQAPRLSADGGFSVSGLRPGAIYWAVAEPFLIKRIERGNLVQDQIIELKAGERIGDIRVVLGYATATISGIVKFVNGALPAGTRVAARLWPTTPTQSRMPVSATFVDPAGRFLMQNVPAGAYRIVISAEREGMQGKTPVSQSDVVVTEGGVTQLSLTLDLTPTP